MKLKYYIGNRIIALIIISFIVSLIVIQHVDAYSLTSSGANPNKIFKCQTTTISANFSDFAAITAVSVTLINEPVRVNGILQYNVTTLSMTDAGSGTWTVSFGGNPNMLRGRRTMSFSVTAGATTSVGSASTVLVYSDTCTGTVTSYTGVSSGLGRYTNMIYSGQFSFLGTSLETSIVGWALFPWVEVWGYLFYVLVVFTVCTTVYLKTQNITQPLVIGIFLLLIFSATAVVEPVYRQWVVFIIALCLTALYYKIFVRD